MKKHYSKIDPWINGVILGTTVLLALGTLVLVRELPAMFRAGTAEAYVVTGVVLLLAATIVVSVWLLRSTWYAVTQDKLIIRSGPFNWDVDYADITQIYPSRTLLSGPALSLGRLVIKRGRKPSVVVSPENKESFLAELQRYVPEALQS